MTLDIHLLGPPKVFHDQTPLPLPGHRPFALLAYLVVTHKAHTRTHLTDLLFTSSADPRAGLRWTLSKLRQALGADLFLANREQVAFNDQACYRCDVDALLGGDLDVVEGVFLEGLHVDQAPLFEEWHLVTAQQLRQAYQDGLLRRIARHEMRGEHREMASLAARLVQMDSLREEWRRLLMRAYIALGEWDAAGQQYEQCRQLLRDELATVPSKETDALWRQLLRRGPLAASRLSTPSAPEHASREIEPVAPAETRQPAKLPFFRTSFVGREVEIHEIQTTVADPDCRLLTVVGPGGIGKTRLAVHAALNLERRFEQGICFVALRQVTAADGMAPAIARSLGLTAYSDEGLREQLVTYVKRKSILVLLDNMEHLLVAPDWDTGEMLLAEILETAPNVRILATSRERLHMPEEWICTLGGLTFASERIGASSDLCSYAATQLFLHRARQLDSAYHPDRVGPDVLDSVAAICRHVSGMPLALEMAAAWVQQMPCAEIAASLDRDLTLLVRSGAQGPERHSSMQTVFEHSWQLLDLDLRQLLARLSVLHGHFDREAAAAVAGGTLFSLSALLDKSLLDSTGDGRYQVHELLRQFAAEKLVADPMAESATREAHSIYYCELCHRLEEDLKGSAQTRAAQQLEDALVNLRAAFTWAVRQGEWNRAADASFSLGYFCRLYGLVEEGCAIFTTVIEALRGTELSSEQALALARASYWLGQLVDGGSATPFLTDAITLLQRAKRAGLGTDFDEAIFEEALAFSSESDGDYAGAVRHCQAGLTSARRSDNPWAEARLLDSYASLQVWNLGRYQDAAQNAGEALQLQRIIDDRIGMMETLGTLCVVETFMRNYERALQISEEKLAISRMLNNDLQTAAAHQTVSWSLLLAGRFDECVAHLRQARSIYDHYGQERQVAETLYGLSWRSCMGGHYESANRYANELTALLAGKPGHRVIRGVFFYVRSQLAFHEERYAAALDYAQKSVEILVQIGSHNQVALAQITLGFAHLARDEVESATEQARLLLSLGTTVGLWGLGVVALVLVKQKPCDRRFEQFYELLALQRTASPMCDAPSYRAIIHRLQPAGLSRLSSERRAAAEARGRSLDPDQTIAALSELFDTRR
jgi:predicted ATPase/DNA-binding SARP family transcriptional activator